MSAFQAGGIKGFIGLDINPFTQGILGAQTVARLFPEIVQSFLANPLLALVDLAKQAGEAIKGVGERYDNLGEAAEAAGVSVPILRDVGAAARDTGSSVQGLAEIMKFLNKNTGEALQGNQQIIADFYRMGVTIGDLRTMAPEELFYKMADGMKALPDAATKTQLAMSLLGRGGSEAIAFLSQGSPKIREFANLVREIHGNSAEQLATWGDSWQRLGVLVGEAWDSIKESLAQPIMEYAYEHSGELLQTVKDLTGAIRGLAQGFGGELLQGFRLFVDVLQFAAQHAEALTRIVLGLIGAIAGFRAGSLLGPIGGLVGMGIGAAAGSVIAQNIISDSQSRGGGTTVNNELNINQNGLDDHQVAGIAGRAAQRATEDALARQDRINQGHAIGQRVRMGL